MVRCLSLISYLLTVLLICAIVDIRTRKEISDSAAHRYQMIGTVEAVLSFLYPFLPEL